jgi:uncharacterized protein YbgA (DUF1722 family)
MEIGLGAPRESLRLEERDASVLLVASRSGANHTYAMRAWAERRVAELGKLGLSGYILKKGSPSCGMERVRVYGTSGVPVRNGRGIFAAELAHGLPLLPVEEEGRLHDAPLRENFVERVFAFHRWSTLLAAEPRPRDLVAFHTAHKLSLLAHSEPHYRTLGRIVACAGRASALGFDAVLSEYGARFMAALAVRATRRKHANVLCHMVGYLRCVIDRGDKHELVARVDDYRRGLVPLLVPLTLLQHHFRRHPVPWIAAQVYLSPYPADLGLRNHA